MKNQFIGKKVMLSKKYAAVGAECHCGDANCSGVAFGEVGVAFHVDGSIKYFTTACYEKMQWLEENETSDFDAIHTINHELLVITDSKETATIKMLQGFNVKAGFGKNKGKYYCRLTDNESCYSTGHYGYPKEDSILEVRVNGKTVNSLKEFREATH